MRVITVILLAALAVIHAELWFGKGGVPRVMSLRAQLQDQDDRNRAGRVRNEQMAAEVRDLQEGLDMAEEIARTELGMVKPGEIYVQVSAPN